MKNWLDESFIQSAFQKMSDYYYKESVLLLRHGEVTFDKIYKNSELPKIDEIELKPEDIKQADEHFQFQYKQELESKMIGHEIEINKMDQRFTFITEPDVLSALSFFTIVIDEGYEPNDIGSSCSFQYLAEDCRHMSILLKNFSRICEALNEMVYIYEPVNYFYELELLKDSLNRDRAAMYERWFESRENLYTPPGLRGGLKTKLAFHKRVIKVKKDILDIGEKHKDGSLRIGKDQFENVLKKHNDNCDMTYPTIKKYKKQIEEELSREYNHRIIIQFKKS